jgi:ubiquinone/menaquinone biosynthesis C-methylase UbiE
MLNRLLRRWRFIRLYQGAPPWQSEVSPPELIQFIDSNPPGRALDLGCGTALDLLTLAEAGWDVTGVDFVPSAVRKARRRFKSAGLSANLHVGDVTQLKFLDEPFGFIFDKGCLHGIPAQRYQNYFETLLRLLKPGGIYMLYTFYLPDGSKGRGLSDAQLKMFSSKLTCISREEGEFDGHSSLWLTYCRPLVS